MILESERKTKKNTGAISIGTQNVRTLAEIGQLKELCYEMEKYKWHVLGLSEVKWPDEEINEFMKISSH